MLFSSMTFIFVFLPIVLVLYLVTKKELHNPILLIASIIFYAWGEPKYLAIMLLTILLNYFGAIAVDKYQTHKKLLLSLTIAANLGFLIYFKYFNFLIDNCNNLFNTHIHALNIIMPIGISFYTFQALSYVVDVYRGECKVQKDIYKLALYICLFPQLIAGPIVKYHDVAEQIDSREVNFKKVNLGVKRFIIGLSKKMLIANTMGAIADKIFIQDPHTFSHITAWIGAFAYSFQLYFDFSGYSDMAIGLGLIFGFKFMENFNYPYISKSIIEFWRRWHISLSTWFKQYIYIPLGGNRHGLVKTLRNLGIVFLLTGIWHGAAWTFVVWGIWHGVLIIIEKLINIKKFEQKYQHWSIRLFQHIYCILAFVIGWVIFRADSISYASKYILNMFGILRIRTEEIVYTQAYYVDNIEVIIFITAVICALPLFKNFLLIKNKVWKIFINTWLLLLFILSVASIASNTYNPFIYFRF
ncbi:MAG: MBOAT family protein [Muribaculaceae bacterium]|nr:MBOAT family protein [Muribaculaceae bacterium]